MQWVADHRAELLDDDPKSPPLLNDLNALTCVRGEGRGKVEAPVATGTEGRDHNLRDCTSTATDPVDHLAAFSSGLVVLTVLAPDTLATAA